MQNYLNVDIKNIKGIKELHIDLPITNGIFAFVGENGSGKSSLLIALAQLIRPQNALFSLKTNDFSNDSNICFCYLEQKDNWIVKNKKWKNTIKTNRKYTESYHRKILENNNIKIYGMYEGSLFVGTRFSDSTKVDALYNNGKRTPEDDLVTADEYVIKNLSFILHGNNTHYKDLKRLKNKKLKEELGLKNLPYFINSTYGGIISQYKMSSGECLLISLLHFIYNSIIRQSLPIDRPILMLLDEIELALHPSAVSRFLDLLNEIVTKYSHVSVFLTTHAAEVIKKIEPINIYKLENNNGIITFVNPCYPAYAIRELYSHDRYDFLILCEDILTKKVIEYVLHKNKLLESKLVYICPVGGWENVLKLHHECAKNNIIGTDTTIISVLDGDIKEDCNNRKEYQNLKKIFLPIQSIEKCLFKILYKNENIKLKKQINDRFFTLKNIETLKSEFIASGTKEDNKKFYLYLKKDLESRNISELEFISKLMEILFTEISITEFENTLKKCMTTYSRINV